MVEMATILRCHGRQYRARYGAKLLPSHGKAMRAIERCRTPALGGQVYQCPVCDETQYLYHSCRDRHCPKCQGDKAQRWLEKQQEMLLPVPYFLLTFTLPSQLRQVVSRHQHTVYGLLFRASAAAIQYLAKDDRFVGGQMGLIGVLHTWGRNLSYHPHVHYLAPGGGLAGDGHTWLPARKNFLLPVKALSRIFRAKFRDALRQSDLYTEIPPEVWEQEWVVHCQPVGDGVYALKYLAPYIFRVAISNRRIVKLANGKVTFSYRTSDTGTLRTCTLAAQEFIRRFLQHVLPRGFVKVRYYGFFSPSARQHLTTLRQHLKAVNGDHLVTSKAAGVESDGGLDADSSTSCTVLCPSCNCPMRRCFFIQPLPRCPPGFPAV